MNGNVEKIAIVTRNLHSGGAERVIAQLVNEWSKNGILCYLVLLDKSEIFYKIDNKVKIIELGKQSNNLYINKILIYKMVRETLIDLKPDIVLSLPEEIGIYVIMACIGTNLPIVVSERNNPWIMPYKKASRLIRRISYLFVDGLIFQTDNAKNFFSRKIREKGIVLPNPLDLSRIPEPFEGIRKKRIVAAGRLEPQKNFPLLVEAFGEFVKIHPDYSLSIYGEGSLRDRIQEIINKKGLEQVICLEGNSKNLLEDIKDASVFVLSSDYEGVPNVLIEAMASGIPVVSTDCKPGGAASLIDNYDNGIIVPTNQVHELANAMTYMIEHPNEAAQMSKKAMLIKEKVNSKKVSSHWLAFLSQCLCK